MGRGAGVSSGNRAGLYDGKAEPRRWYPRHPHGFGNGGRVGVRDLRCVFRRPARLRGACRGRADRVDARDHLCHCGRSRYGHHRVGGPSHGREGPARRRAGGGSGRGHRHRNLAAVRLRGGLVRAPVTRMDGCFAGDRGKGHQLHPRDVRGDGDHSAPLSQQRHLPGRGRCRHRDARPMDRERDQSGAGSLSDLRLGSFFPSSV